MQNEFAYRGRKVSAAEMEGIRALIAAHPTCSRWRLSFKLCEAWNWVQPNGQPRAMLARSLMLALHRAGHIRLPAQRFRPPNNVVHHRAPVVEPELPLESGTLECSLAELGSLEIRQVRRTPEEALFGRLLQSHHYLRYTRPVGEHLKQVVYAQGRPVACLAWSSAPRHLGPRDRFIGWCPEQRRAHLHLVAYNTRFLILPCVRVPHLASHLLAQAVRQLSADWERLYAHPIYLAETFIDPERFRGTCYRAANWIHLGATTGRGRQDRDHTLQVGVKDLYVYPLQPHFREVLCHDDD